MEHFLKKTTSVSSSMNQSGGSPSDIKSPPLLSQTITGSKTTNTISEIEHRPTGLYTSSYRPQLTSSTSSNSKFISNDISQTIANNNSHSDKDASLKPQSVSNESKSDTSSRAKENSNGVINEIKKDTMKTKQEKEYTEIERIEVPSLSMPQSKQGAKSASVRVGKKTESSTDPPMKSEHSSEDDDESSETTSTDSFSECSESSNECAKIDFGDEGGVDEEGNYTTLY